MAKSEKQVDKILNDAIATHAPVKTKKGKINMKKESIKTWTIVTLIGVIFITATAIFAYSQGYDAKQADVQRFNTEVAQQVAKLKANQ